LEEARRAYEQALDAGCIPAGINLGVLLATMVQPPDLPAARAVLARATELAVAEQRIRRPIQLDPDSHPVVLQSFFVEMASAARPKDPVRTYATHSGRRKARAATEGVSAGG
jgi:hypothetical protein